jgi:hypothetical protein
MGAATFGSGVSGVKGVISAANSLVGSTVGDAVGSDGITALTNGNYVVVSPNWNGAKGAVTFGSGTTGVKGVVSAVNSLVGSAPGDYAGAGGITPLNNGNYVVNSPNWTNGAFYAAGALTLGNGVIGISGAISPANSIVGKAANTGLQSTVALDNVNGTFIGSFLTEDGGIVRVGLQRLAKIILSKAGGRYH